eukprot:244532-Rhodomonas_salina.1
MAQQGARYWQHFWGNGGGPPELISEQRHANNAELIGPRWISVPSDRTEHCIVGAQADRGGYHSGDHEEKELVGRRVHACAKSAP